MRLETHVFDVYVAQTNEVVQIYSMHSTAVRTGCRKDQLGMSGVESVAQLD